MEKYEYWYCKYCEEERIPSRVTNDEKCDWCGHPVEWISSDALPGPQPITVSDWEKQNSQVYQDDWPVWMVAKPRSAYPIGKTKVIGLYGNLKKKPNCVEFLWENKDPVLYVAGPGYKKPE